MQRSVAATARAITPAATRATPYASSGDVWERLDETDRRIDKSGAMNAAMVQMGTNAAGSRSPCGRVAVGVGFQDGERVSAVGYAKAIGERASFSIGASFSGDESSAGVGFAIDL